MSDYDILCTDNVSGVWTLKTLNSGKKFSDYRYIGIKATGATTFSMIPTALFITECNAEAKASNKFVTDSNTYGLVYCASDTTCYTSKGSGSSLLTVYGIK